MKRTTKGSLAAATAVLLLLGGAGTIAFWSGEASVPGGEIASGELGITAGDCTDWVDVDGGAPIGQIVPGDAITKRCTFTVLAGGDNLTADVDVPDTIDVTPTSTPAPTTLRLDVSADYELVPAGGGAPTPLVDGDGIDEGDDGASLVATIVVAFPFDAPGAVVNANDTQNLVGDLDDITVTLTQTD